MGAKVKIVFNSAGFREVLLSGGAQAAVRSAASQVASRAGAGAKVRTMRGGYGGGRHIAFVTVRGKKDSPEFQAAKRRLEGAL